MCVCAVIICDLCSNVSVAWASYQFSLPNVSSTYISSVCTVGKSHHPNSLSPGLLAGNGMERRHSGMERSMERRHKLSSSTWTQEVRIEEEEEEKEAEEGVAEKVGLSEHPANGTAVWKENKDCNSSMQSEGTADNGASQEQAVVRVVQGTWGGSMLATGSTAASLIHGHGHPRSRSEGKVGNREATPPPPPPKKQHR